MPSRPARSQKTPLAAALANAPTLWAAACALLREWRARRPIRPARHSTGPAWSAWAGMVERTHDHFAGGRAAEDLGDGDRAFLLELTGGGRMPDAVDAAAWGLSNATSHTFAPAWRDELAAARHTLADGELYPVADAPWALGPPLSPRPASLTPPLVDELPTIRAHRAADAHVTVDSTLARTLEAIAAGLDAVAALHPNEHLDELDFPADAGQVFPVGPRDPGEQRVRLERLTRAALESAAPVAVLPELCLRAGDVDALHERMLDVDEPRLLVAGSHHALVDGQPENVAVGLVSGAPERMEHLKATPFSDELRLRRPTKEGIRRRERAELVVHQADRFRVALAVCKELLDGRVAAALDRMGVNLLLVPGLSAKTTPFLDAAAARVAGAQALTVLVNGPLRDAGGERIEPAIVIGQPVPGRSAVGRSPAGPAPSVTVVELPA